MRRKFLLYTAITILQAFVASMLFAQQFGGNPPSLKWRQLKTDSVNVLFPKGADSAALHVAAIIAQLQGTSPYSLGSQLENPPIILQTETTNSNGYVGLGPYRSEFFLSAPMDVMDLGSIDWASTLALHEYRHVIQYNNINKGITRIVGRILGDNARALFSDMAVPNWFFEGDAVFNETLHSNQGRGRLPRFMNTYATLDKDGRSYGYAKLRNGSFKDYIPNHYNLGYLLVTYGYRQYGPGFWGRVIKDAGAYKGLFYPFQKAIRRTAGVSFKDFREAAFKDYLHHYENLSWQFNLSDTGRKNQQVTRLPVLSRVAENEVIHYMYPYPARLDGKDGVIALKNPRKSTSRFVWLDDNFHGKEQNLGEAPIARNAYFGYKAGRIVYTCYQTDPRWGYKQYSDLEVLDISSGKRERRTHKGRYFTPDISRDGKRIAASTFQPDGHSAIVLLDSAGHRLAQWDAPRGALFNYPKFFTLPKEKGPKEQRVHRPGGADTAAGTDTENALLFLVRHSDGKMGINYVRLPENKPLSTDATITGHPDSLAAAMQVILPMSGQLLAFPVVHANKLYFSAVRPGPTDPYTELLELDLAGLIQDSPKIQPVRLGRTVRDIYQGYGTGNLHNQQGGQIVASLETAQGYKIFKWSANAGLLSSSDQHQPSAYSETKERKNGFENGFEKGSEKGSEKGFGFYLPIKSQDTAFMNAGKLHPGFEAADIRPYRLLSHPFHFHSLQPTIEDPVYSLDLLGQNILNTVQTTISYRYNRVSRISQLGGDLTLGTWWLQPFIHMDYGWNHQAADSKGRQYSYKELTSQVGLQLPLSFTYGRWQRSLYLSTAVSQSNVFWQQPAPSPGAALSELRYLYSRLQLSIFARKSALQLYPRFGLNNYTEMNTPLDGKGARQWMNSATFYLPGVLSTHSLRWNLAYQHRDTAGAYGYNSRFPFSRGYIRPAFSTMWKFGVDYDLPVWYPDFGFGGLAYFSRIRANLYFDQSYGFDQFNKRSNFGSAGGAIYADMQIGNQYPITIGLRYNHILNQAYPEKNNWEFILPIRLF